MNTSSAQAAVGRDELRQIKRHREEIDRRAKARKGRERMAQMRPKLLLPAAEMIKLRVILEARNQSLSSFIRQRVLELLNEEIPEFPTFPYLGDRDRESPQKRSNLANIAGMDNLVF